MRLSWTLGVLSVVVFVVSVALLPWYLWLPVAAGVIAMQPSIGRLWERGR